MTGLVKDKVVVVTGGSSGIGRASALVFALEGAKVAIADLDVAGGEETVKMIKNIGGDAIFIRADVTKAKEIERFISKVTDTYERLDCAHNNVGHTGVRSSIEECTEKNWDYVMNVSLKSVWLCMKYEIPQMLKSGGGAIVNTSSTAGLLGFKYGSAYSSAKHGVLGLTKSAALEYADKGIRANAICPGLTRTSEIERIISDGPQREARFMALSPMGRMAESEEIAKAVVWLCSDMASFINGHSLVVDGGFVIS